MLKIFSKINLPYSIYSSYVGVVREVVTKDGWIGLFGRGLKTRLIANGIQVKDFKIIFTYTPILPILNTINNLRILLKFQFIK